MSNLRLKGFYRSIVGDIDLISSERHFVTISAFTASIFLLILCIVHVIMGLKLAPVIFAACSSVGMLILYGFVRFGKCLYIPKVALTVLGLIMLDFTWYSKFLSNGPLLFFILIFGALVLWVWEGKCLVILLIFYFLNLAALGIIESKAPSFLLKYPLPETRTLDIYLSFFLYSSLLIGLLYIVKREFVRQRERAMKSDKLKSAFLANMSHEIRTPLNSIVGFSQLLNDEDNLETKEQYSKIIQNSSDNLLRLINDIIDLSKIEAGDLEVKLSVINLKDLFTELKEYYSIELRKKGKEEINLDFSYNCKQVLFQSDYLRLKQIISNLLNNSIKFTTRGSVSLQCIKSGGKLVFTISDTGIGIPESDKIRIFDRFVKFNHEGLNTEGSGIGLSVVENLVKLLGGKLWFESTFGKGSDFYFSIPFIAAPTNLKNNKTGAAL